MKRADIDKLVKELETLANQYRAAAFVRKFDIDEMIYWIGLESDCWKALYHLFNPQRKG